MGPRGESGIQGRLIFQSAATLLAVLATLAACLAIGGGGTSEAAVSAEGLAKRGILPCGRRVVLTAVYRNREGQIHFEGVANPYYAGEKAWIYDKFGEPVASAIVGEDGIFWTNAVSKDKGYTWVTRFIAEVDGYKSRWRRIGQAVGIRDRKPYELAPTASNEGKLLRARTRVKVKVSGGHNNLLIVGLQVGCSRFDVIELASTYTDVNGVSDLNLPRPPAGLPYWIFRVGTEDDWRISPPIIVRSAAQSGITN